MNRICAQFDDIGKMSTQIEDLPAFNWHMLLSGPCKDTRNDICELFCQMDSTNLTNVIESREYDYSYEKESKAGYDLLAQMITDEINAKYGSLEFVFPYITKYLFAGDAAASSSHKKMYWRVFGEIALDNIKKNLETCTICNECEMKIPKWETGHSCTEEMQGFFICEDCHTRYPRMNSKQCRCENCQKNYKRSRENARKQKRYMEKKQKRWESALRLNSKEGA